ncbi:MAG TPA: GNAT family N-acetyltransferase [Saprospiraceae bacterium]|nr:GNAT family N-acetyltransferase [Saprospiraceae bacterium]HMQ84571.1 GNAT family N-acetyltransferase [Saprospiraceae bacterium]
MSRLQNIKTIAFDADDTLWVNEPFFQQTQQQFKALFSSLATNDDMENLLYEVERKNLRFFGYGIKGFTLSLIETAIQLSDGRISGQTIQQIIDFGKEMLLHPIEVLDGVEDTLKALHPYYKLMVITKGDLFDQENKLARSGLADYFTVVEIVSEKNEATYQSIFNRHQLLPEQVLMVGNSLKSDIIPVCKIGAQAIHVPFHTTWIHEQVEKHQVEDMEYLEIDHIEQVVRLLNPKKSPAYEDVQVFFAGNGFNLRRLREEDAESFSRHANNPNIAKNLRERFPHPYTLQDAVAFIEYAAKAEEETIFTIEVDGEAAGSIGFIFQPDVYQHSAELGYWLSETHWGKGITAQAVRKMVQHGFEDLELKRIFARVYDFNQPSIRVLEKAGFAYETRLKKAAIKRGAVCDVLYYVVFAPGF